LRYAGFTDQVVYVNFLQSSAARTSLSQTVWKFFRFL
jgi:hypothetical protein